MQLKAIKDSNAIIPEPHTGIRNEKDIKTFEEALADKGYAGDNQFTPDWSRVMAKKAMKEGNVTVYSSYPIEQGTFVTPSKIEAESYAGNGNVYQKVVAPDDVAWINIIEGQYAKVKYSLPTDADYLSAVKRGDVAAAQKMVDEAAKKAGYGTRGYHGSRESFTVFSHKDIYGGKSNSIAGIGFWFTPSKSAAQNWTDQAWWGKGEPQVYDSYLKINNPKVYETTVDPDKETKIQDIYDKLDVIEEKAKKLYDKHKYDMEEAYIFSEVSLRRNRGKADDILESKKVSFGSEEYDALKKDVTSYVEYKNEIDRLTDESLSYHYSDAYEKFKTDVYKLAGMNAEDANFGGMSRAIEGGVEQYRDKLKENLKKQGYDGMVIKNTKFDADTMGERNTQYVVFDPEQIKSADPVTYDDNGNVIPLSERFNSEKDDIRFSLPAEDSEGKTLTDDQRKYFGESKALDYNGNLLHLWHGAEDGGFTVFDPKKSDDKTSLFFTDNKDVAMTYSDGFDDKATEGPMNYPVYLNLENPLLLNGNGNAWWNNVSAEGYDRILIAKDGVYSYDVYSSTTDETYFEEGDLKGTFGKEIADAIIKKGSELTGGLEQTTILTKDGKVIEDEGTQDASVHNGKMVAGNTRAWANYAKEHGYDGVIFRDIYDEGKYSDMGMFAPSTVCIAFNSDQVKDIYNEHPTADDDIRFSLPAEDSEGKTLTDDQRSFFKNISPLLCDDEGRIKVLYHGTDSGGFTIFEPGISDDSISIFMTDSPSMAASYSNSKEEITPFIGSSFKDAVNWIIDERNGVDVEIETNHGTEKNETYYTMNEYLEDYPLEEYPDGDKDVQSIVIHNVESGKEINKCARTRELAEKLDESDFTDGEYVSGLYPVYVNLQNPYVVNCHGQSSDEITEEGFDKLTAYPSSYTDYNSDEAYYDVRSMVTGDFDTIALNTIKERYGEDAARIVGKSGGDFWTYNGEFYNDEKNEYLISGTTREWCRMASKMGHDGIIFNDIVDNGPYSDSDAAANVYVSFAGGSAIKSIYNEHPTIDDDIRYSVADDLSDQERKTVSYDSLISKRNLPFTKMEKIYTPDIIDKDTIVDIAILNIRELEKVKNNRPLSVFCTDIDESIITGKRGIGHALSWRNMNDNFTVTPYIGKLLKNAVRINYLKPRGNSIGGYVLISCGKDLEGNLYPVYFIVDRFETGLSELVEFNTLHSSNAKKIEASALSGRGFQSLTSIPTISIKKLLEIVNKDYSDILSDDVLKYYGNERKKTKLSDAVRFSAADDQKLTREQETRKLAATVERLRGEMKLTHNSKPNKADIKREANYLCKFYTSNVPVQAVEDGLTEMYEILSRGNGAQKELSNADMDEFSRYAMDIAEDIVKHGGFVTDEGSEELAAAKEYFKGNHYYIPADLAADVGYKNYTEFRKLMFGYGVYVTKNEALNYPSFDGQMIEFEQEAPGMFPKGSTHTTTANVLDYTINEVLKPDTEKFVGYDIYSDEGQSVIVDIAEHIADTLELINPKWTFADRKKAERNRAVARTNKKWKEREAKHKAHYLDRIGAMQATAEAKLAGERAKNIEKTAELKAKHKQEKKDIRAKNVDRKNCKGNIESIKGSVFCV